MRLTVSLAVVCAALALSSAAMAQEEKFTISSGANVLETFDLNAADGSFQAQNKPRSSTDILTFDISNDSLGNSSATFAFKEVDGQSVPSSYIFQTNNGHISLVDYGGSPSVYNGGPTLNVVPGGTYTLNSGDTLAVSAVSAAPEPSSWALMMVGTALAGGALSSRRRRQAAGVAA